MIGTCISLISRMSFYMAISMKKFPWSNLRGLLLRREIGKMCCLRKSLYGLKQSPCTWFDKFNQAVEAFGMEKSKSDHSVFYRNSSSGIILLVVCMDDIVITGSDPKCILSLKPFLHNKFHTKDL